MYLHPDARGRGLGKLLLERALGQARALGFRRVELETAGVLEAAIALYRRYGFEPFDKPHVAARCDQAFALELD
jgi:putative acetyltransferase